MNYLRKLILKNKNELKIKIDIKECEMNYTEKLILKDLNEFLKQINITKKNELTTKNNTKWRE